MNGATAMDDTPDDRLARVIARIEKALHRIEDAADQPAPDYEAAERHNAVQESYVALEDGVRGALRDLDALIERIDQ